ncbi:unnamed protein product [Fraxinus pennsylvanica]|uniref:Uncharacterized protein n=1 Tax=Fraxinus pennsylvanica TaxID=56036 RepID=A0AAD2ACE8_9LAMI|nr:unnamed protein product [Fraxinus pennsylvanica]
MALTICSAYLFYLLFLSLLLVASANGYGYGYGAPKPKLESPDPRKEFLPASFRVQGIIYCKSGSKLNPLKGAIARITCLALDKYGYEPAPFSILSRPTDANGYFLTKLSFRLEDGCKITQCKTFLESSPSNTCQFASDVNYGSNGVVLSAYRLVGGQKGTRLYSVGPFVYTSEPKTAPNGY